jgi:hypothetical protein
MAGAVDQFLKECGVEVWCIDEARMGGHVYRVSIRCKRLRHKFWYVAFRVTISGNASYGHTVWLQHL